MSDFVLCVKGILIFFLKNYFYLVQTPETTVTTDIISTRSPIHPQTKSPNKKKKQLWKMKRGERKI